MVGNLSVWLCLVSKQENVGRFFFDSFWIKVGWTIWQFGSNSFGYIQNFCYLENSKVCHQHLIKIWSLGFIQFHYFTLFHFILQFQSLPLKLGYEIWWFSSPSNFTSFVDWRLEIQFELKFGYETGDFHVDPVPIS